MTGIRNRFSLLACAALVVTVQFGCTLAGAADSVAGTWTYRSTEGSVISNWTFVIDPDGAWTLSGIITGAADGTENLSGSGTYTQDTLAKTIALSGSTALTHGSSATTYGWLLGLYTYSHSGRALTLDSGSGAMPMFKK
jgi:hypothetical protein